MISNIKNVNVWIDIDEVLADTVREFLKFVKTKFDMKLERDWLYNYFLQDVKESWISKEQFFALWKEFSLSGHTKDLPTVKWSYQLLYHLKNNWNKVFAITWRHEFEKENTEHWLNKNYPNLVDELIFTNFLSSEMKYKSEYINKYDIKLFFDDIYEFCSDVASNSNIPVYMPTKPWNVHYQDLHKNIVRIKNLTDLI